jgi:hypothetical protein
MKLPNASIELKIYFFNEIIITVFQFTQRATINRSVCHTWHTYRRLLMPDINIYFVVSFVFSRQTLGKDMGNNVWFCIF